MKVELKNDYTKQLESGTLVRFGSKNADETPRYYAIYLADIDGDNPILYDLQDDVYYDGVDMYNIEVVDKNYKLVIE